MQTRSGVEASDYNLSKIVAPLKITGWLSFWLQLALGVAASLSLIFAISGRNFSNGDIAGIGVGIFLAVCSIVLLLVGIYSAFRYTHLSRRFSRASNHQPRKVEVTQILRVGIIVGLVGMLLSILGGGATLGVLLSKSIALPQGVAIYDPTRIIRSLDIFVAMANMNNIAGHFIGIVSSLGLLNWLSRQ